MKLLPRIVMVIGLLGLASLFFFPMWRITLIAPQYPTGISMFIHIDKIGGDSPSTLQNVNILNHYIGMQKIVPESIPELVYFPKVIYGMLFLGLIAVFINKRWAYLTWGGIMILLSLAGVYDFYLWEYDYGHNLADNAPMKFENASFQPPLIGRKDIINFVAISMPHTAGYLAGIGMMLSFVAAWLRKPDGKILGKSGSFAMSIVTMLGLILGGCSAQPQPIDFGSDSCEFCRMTIVDKQHAAQVVNEHGKAYNFDAVECMINYLGAETVVEFPLQLICDYDQPGQLIDARQATYLISKNLPSPMGANLTGFAGRGNALKMQAEREGEVFDYQGLLEHLAQ